MVSIQKTVSIAASATNDNVLQGELFEFIPSDFGAAIVTIGIHQSAAGLKCDVMVGGEILAKDINPRVKDAIPDDTELTMQTIGLSGDRIVIKAQNTTAAAINLHVRVDIEPVPVE